MYSTLDVVRTGCGSITRLLWAMFLGLWLSGCASVPLSSMAKLSGFDETDFLQLDPRQLQVRGTIDKKIGADLARAVSLAMVLKTPNGEIPLQLPLQTLYRQTLAARNGLFSSSPAMEVTTLALTPAGITEFEKLQQLLARQQIRGGSFSAGINRTRDNTRQRADEVRVSVAIRLTEDQGFITLIDNHSIDLRHAFLNADPGSG